VGLGLLLQGREALDLDAVLVVGLGQVEEDADGGDALVHVGQGKVAVAGGVEQRADKVGRLSDVFFRFFLIVFVCSLNVVSEGCGVVCAAGA
jgi:hypothetical protein